MNSNDVRATAVVCRPFLAEAPDSGFAGVLAAVVDAAPPGVRGFHDWGRPDAAGFAAIGCVELLAHTWDAAGGLGVAFVPPAELVRPVVRRTFPWAPEQADPWTALLWASGRGELSGQPRQVSWRWHSAPLEEWDGTIPRPGSLDVRGSAPSASGT